MNPQELREVAVKAKVDPRTVRAYLTGKKVRSTTRANLEKTLGTMRSPAIDDTRHPRSVYPDLVERDGRMFASIPDENVNDVDIVFACGTTVVCVGHRFSDDAVVWDLKATEAIDYLVDILDDPRGRALMLAVRRSRMAYDRTTMKEES